MTTLTLGLAQTCTQDNEFNQHLINAEHWYAQAKTQGCDLLAFPEIFLTQFFPQYPDRHDMSYPLRLDSPEIKMLQRFSKAYRMGALPNVLLDVDGAKYDATLFIDQDGTIGSISKMVHIADQPQFHETAYYTPAPDGFKVFSYQGFNIGVIICFDRHFPESFRLCVQQGADLIIIPTANTVDEPQSLFDAEIQVSAFQNSVYVAMVNRTGVEDQMHFCGRSCFVDASGNIVKQANAQAGLFVEAIDRTKIREQRDKNCYLATLRCSTELK